MAEYDREIDFAMGTARDIHKRIRDVGAQHNFDVGAVNGFNIYVDIGKGISFSMSTRYSKQNDFNIEIYMLVNDKFENGWLPDGSHGGDPINYKNLNLCLDELIRVKKMVYHPDNADFFSR